MSSFPIFPSHQSERRETEELFSLSSIRDALWFAHSHHKLAMQKPVTEPLLIFLHGMLFCLSPVSQFLNVAFSGHSGSGRSTLFYGSWLSAYPTYLKHPGMRNEAKVSLSKIRTYVDSCLLGLHRTKWPLNDFTSLVCPGAECLRVGVHLVPVSLLQYLMVLTEVGT